MTEIVKIIQSDGTNVKKQVYPQTHADGVIDLEERIKQQAGLVTSVNGETGDVEINLKDQEVVNARVNSDGKTFDSLKSRIDDSETAITTKLSEISTAPETFDNLAALKSQYPSGKTGIFVTANDWHKYIWSHGQWTDAGLYQSVAFSEQNKKEIGSISKQYNGLFYGSDLLSSSNGNLLPYASANGKSNLEFVSKYNGRNWVKVTQSDTSVKYDGVKISGSIDTSDGSILTSKLKLKARVINQLNSDLSLIAYLNVMGASGFISNTSVPINVSFVNGKETELELEFPSVSSFIDLSKAVDTPNYLAVSITNLYPNAPVKFLITETNLYKTSTSIYQGDLTAHDMTVADYAKNKGNLISDSDLIFGSGLGPYSSANGKSKLELVKNYNGKNWVKVTQDDPKLDYDGFKVDIPINDSSKWLLDSPLKVSMEISNLLDTDAALIAYVNILGPSGFVGNVPITINSSFVKGTDTITKFDIGVISQLIDLSKAPYVPGLIRISIVNTDKYKTTQYLVRSVNVSTSPTEYSQGSFSGDSKSVIEYIENSGSFISGGGLLFGSGLGPYSSANGKSKLELVKNYNGKNWVKVTQDDSSVDYDGVKVSFNITGSNSYKANLPLTLSFKVINLLDKELKLSSFMNVLSPSGFVGNVMNNYKDKLTKNKETTLTVNIGAVSDEVDFSKSVTPPDWVAFPIVNTNPNETFSFLIRDLKVTQTPAVKTEDDDVDVTISSRLPKVYLNGAIGGMNGSTYKPMSLKFVDHERVLELFANMKWQGDSSQAYQKKNYKLKLFSDEQLTTKKKITPFSGWQKDNEFNLKANYIDVTHGRNIVNSEIFSEITADRDGLRSGIMTSDSFVTVKGNPVLLYINGNPMGLYTFNTTKGLYDMDDDNDNHIVVSGAEWTNEVIFKTDTAKLDGTDFEIIQNSGKNDDTVAKFSRLMKFVNSSSDADFIAHQYEYLDVNSFIDYALFTIAIQNSDALGKNCTYATWDGNVWSATAYDLDSTWQLYWDGSKLTDATENLFGFRGNRIFTRTMKLNKDLLLSRYQELRQHQLNEAYIIDKFKNWIDNVGQENYDLDLKLWPNLPSADLTGLKQLRIAICTRLAAVDEQIKNI